MSGTTGPLARDRVVISVMFATVGSVGDICRRVGPSRPPDHLRWLCCRLRSRSVASRRGGAARGRDQGRDDGTVVLGQRRKVGVGDLPVADDPTQ